MGNNSSFNLAATILPAQFPWAKAIVAALVLTGQHISPYPVAAKGLSVVGQSVTAQGATPSVHLPRVPCEDLSMAERSLWGESRLAMLSVPVAHSVEEVG